MVSISSNYGIRGQVQSTPKQSHAFVRFSKSTPDSDSWNGVFLTVERPPVSLGGLAPVSEGIPSTINRMLKNRKAKFVVIHPRLKPLDDKEKTLDAAKQSKPCGLQTELKGANGSESFTMRQVFDEPHQTLVYNIEAPKVFGPHPNTYFNYDANITDAGQAAILGNNGKDAIFRGNMMFNRAAAHFTPLLNTVVDKAFPDGNANIVFANDWHSAPALLEMQNKDQMAKVFMLHNTFDEARPVAEAKNMGLKIPDYAEKSGIYSPLTIGIKESDVIIADPNYVRSITEIMDEKCPSWVRALKDKIDKGNVFAVHHDPGFFMNPYNHPHLRSNGFVELKPSTTAEQAKANLKEFKLANKKALQEKVGLTQDPEASIFLWFNRFDINQKGFGFLLRTTDAFLKANPKAQILISKDTIPDAKARYLTEKYLNKMTKAFPGRFVSKERNEIKHYAMGAFAGGSFMLVPSLYEPYGISHLEGMKMGTVPITHAVDGLLSSSFDPGMPLATEARHIRYMAQAHRPPLSYGQTTVMMPRVHVYEYQWAMQKWIDKQTAPFWKRPFIRPDMKALKSAEKVFLQTLNRAMDIANKTPDKLYEVGVNGMNYVNSEHRWDRMAQFYEKAIERAVELRNNRIKTAVS